MQSDAGSVVMSKPILIESPTREIKDEVVTLSPVGEKRETALGMFSRLLRLDTLGSGARARSTSESEVPPEPPTIYYGVYIPCELKNLKLEDKEALHVYKDKSEAMELVKRYKQARFKSFRSMQEAVAFALRGTDPDVAASTSTLMGEKPYPFKGPSSQELVALRKAIEAGREAAVRECVWENPRYLVSSGNTPAILQEGSRYNALHVAAKALNAEMCNLILTTVGSPDFVERLYGVDTDPATCREFAALLVDRYLNTPDKGLNETPLHFAAKFGAVSAVDVLTSFPQCDRHAVNKFGETPKDVICKRDAGKDKTAAGQILRLLGERYYVPVFHSEDDSRQPTIGDIFTPSTPPEVNMDPMSPRLEIRAYAGPMEARDALQFRRKWKTPPRSSRAAAACASPAPAATTPTTPTASAASRPTRLVAPATFRLNEITKGLETVGRSLAEEMKVGWKEYWPFLDTFTDFRTPEGLALLENYLKSEYEAAYTMVVSVSDVSVSALGSPEQSPVVGIMNLSQSPMDPLTPVSELCVALQGCSLASNNRPSRFGQGLALSRARRLNPRCRENGDHQSPPASHSVSQLMCMERTCQVFAKRIADALHLSLSAEPEVAGDSLKSEAKHLQHTVYSYMDDERFQAIDFALVHARLAQLAVLRLRQHTSDLDDVNVLVEFLTKLRCPNDDIFSSDEERRPSCRYTSRSKKADAEVDSHVRCLAGFISEELTERAAPRGPSASQQECVAVWAAAARCACAWSRDTRERSGRRGAGYKRSHATRADTAGAVVKQLMFLELDDDGAVKADVNCNSPLGDTQSFSINVDKCQVVPSNELVSEDESDEADEPEGEAYLTASEHEEEGEEVEARRAQRGDDDDEMADTSDKAAVEAFIYGEEPCKMDRLVFDAVADVIISPEEFPNVYRWRHTVALYPPDQRNKWQPSPTADDSYAEPVSYSFHVPPALASSPLPSPRRRLAPCTPPRAASAASPLPPERCRASGGDAGARQLPLQLTNWLRVTGPNSPRSVLSHKNVGHNVSFGF